MERVRGYVVSQLMDEIRAKQMRPEEIQAMARQALDATEGKDDNVELLQALKSLADQYPILENAHLKQFAYLDDMKRAKIATQVSELLQQGKLEEAGALAASYTHKEQDATK